MRTLKKTLALVLVVAMLLSFAVTASAAGLADESFTDAEEIQNDLAVNTMIATGVINGMGDGTFDPAGTLTRAQGAKMIACLLGMDDYIEKCETPFADVPEAFWASGYIAYAAANGIIDGYGDGNFGPNDTLTGYQWAKMLICALWSEDKITGLTKNADGEWDPALTGAAWQINVAKIAVENKIWDGDDSKQKEAVTRDNACLHAYNAMDYAIAPVVVLNEFLAPASLEWSMGAGDDKVVLQTEAIEPVLTYTEGFKVGDLLKDLAIAEDAVYGTDYTMTWAMDGVSKGALTWSYNMKDVDVTVAGNGVLAEVYAVDSNTKDEIDEYQIIFVNTNVVTVAKEKIHEATEKKAAYVEIDKYEIETEEIAENDVVLYTVGQVATEDGKGTEAGIVEWSVVEPVTVKVTAKGDGYVKVGDTKYEPAKNATNFADLTVGAEKNIYLDQYGYVKSVVAVPGDTTTDSDVTLAYVVDFYTLYTPAVEAEKDAYGQTVPNTGSAEKTDLYAQVVTMDGEVKDYLVGTAAAKTVTNTYADFAKDIAKLTYNETTKLYALEEATGYAKALGLNKDAISVKDGDTNFYYDKAEYVSVVGSLGSIEVAEGTLKAAAANDAEWVVYTAVESTSNATVSKVFYWAENETTEDPTIEWNYAILATDDAAIEESSITYIDEETEKEVTTAVYTYEVYINGEKTEIQSYESTLADDFYKYYIDEHGIYVLGDLTGVVAKVTNVYGNYVSIQPVGGEVVADNDISGLKIVDLSGDTEDNDAGIINVNEYVVFYASVDNTGDEPVYTIDCVYIVAEGDLTDWLTK